MKSNPEKTALHHGAKQTFVLVPLELWRLQTNEKHEKQTKKMKNNLNEIKLRQRTIFYRNFTFKPFINFFVIAKAFLFCPNTSLPRSAAPA